MIKYIFILLIVFLLPVTTGCTDTNLTHDIPLVPRPAHLVPGSGNYLFSDKTVFVVENEEQATVAASLIPDLPMQPVLLPSWLWALRKRVMFGL